MQDHQRHVVEKMWKPILSMMKKLLLKCMLTQSSYVAALVGVDLSRAIGVRMSTSRRSHVRRAECAQRGIAA